MWSVSGVASAGRLGQSLAGPPSDGINTSHLPSLPWSASPLHAPHRPAPASLLKKKVTEDLKVGVWGGWVGVRCVSSEPVEIRRVSCLVTRGNSCCWVTSRCRAVCFSSLNPSRWRVWNTQEIMNAAHSAPSSAFRHIWPSVCCRIWSTLKECLWNVAWFNGGIDLLMVTKCTRAIV